MRKVIIATVVIFVFTVCQMLCASSILPVTPTPTITPTLYEKENPDGKTTIQLNSPGLTATQPRNIVAEDDDYEIEGTATGVADVDIVLIGPGYYGGDGKLGVEYGLDILSSSVIKAEFSEDITMEEGLDTGMWIAAVLSPGRDGEYSTGDEAGGLGLVQRFQNNTTTFI